jgi:hypothetical protein
MGPMGGRRRQGAYRCPECKAIFLDISAMGGGMGGVHGGRPPMWAPVVMSVLMSLGVTMVVRRLRHRSATADGEAPAAPASDVEDA